MKICYNLSPHFSLRLVPIGLVMPRQMLLGFQLQVLFPGSSEINIRDFCEPQILLDRPS